jgi:hypothetical protein
MIKLLDKGSSGGISDVHVDELALLPSREAEEGKGSLRQGVVSPPFCLF